MKIICKMKTNQKPITKFVFSFLKKENDSMHIDFQLLDLWVQENKEEVENFKIFDENNNELSIEKIDRLLGYLEQKTKELQHKKEIIETINHSFDDGSIGKKIIMPF